MESIKEILQELGYVLTPDTDGFRSAAIFRGGDNPSALKIYNDGRWQDFVQMKYGSFEELVNLTLGNQSLEQTREWLKNKNFVESEKHTKNQKPKITIPTIFSPEILNDFEQAHDYYLNRGISLDVLKEFRGGLIKDAGKMKNRYCFPIYDDKNNIIGLTGRSLDAKHKIRHKHLGSVKTWAYPIHLNKELIREKSEIILLEGLPDLLSLFTAGIRNCMCLWGLEAHLAIINICLRLNVTNFIISVNSDSPGIEAAEKLKRKFSKYFSAQNIRILLPKGQKDWNNILMESGVEEIRKQFNVT